MAQEPTTEMTVREATAAICQDVPDLLARDYGLRDAIDIVDDRVLHSARASIRAEAREAAYKWFGGHRAEAARNPPREWLRAP